MACRSPDASTSRQALMEGYGLQPFAASLFGETTYYLHLLLEVGDQAQVIYPSGDLTEADIRQGIESALKRSSSGFLQVVGLWQPTIQPDPMMAQFGQMQQQPFSTWNTLYQSLSQEYEVRSLDLSDGQVPTDVDVLLFLAPLGMNDMQRYAFDQFLMRGGSVIVAGSNFRASVDPLSGGLSVTPIEDGLTEMLAHYGVTVDPTLVMDPQNEPFPITVNRDVGGFTVQEIQALNYPYFVDVRSDGMSQESPIISNLPAVTLQWASPVRLDEAKNAERDTLTLLQSTAQAWVNDDTNVQPDPQTYPDLGFPAGEERGVQPLAVSVIGSFESYFADKEIPQPGEEESSTAETTTPVAPTTGTITQSPDTARLVVIGSDFLNDTVFTISSQMSMDRYLNSLQLVQNTVDWSVEDLDLLEIRTRGTYARVLDSLTENEQSLWEFGNYAFALLALVAIGAWWATRRRSEQPMQLSGHVIEPTEVEVSL